MYERSSGFVGPHRFMHCHLQIILQSITCRCACITLLAIASVGIFSAKVSAATPNRGQDISDTVEEEFRQRNGASLPTGLLLRPSWLSPVNLMVTLNPVAALEKKTKKAGLVDDRIF